MAAVDEIKEMSIPDFVSMLGEFSLLDGDTMGMLDGIRGIASEQVGNVFQYSFVCFRKI